MQTSTKAFSLDNCSALCRNGQILKNLKRVKRSGNCSLTEKKP